MRAGNLDYGVLYWFMEVDFSTAEVEHKVLWERLPEHGCCLESCAVAGAEDFEPIVLEALNASHEIFVFPTHKMSTTYEPRNVVISTDILDMVQDIQWTSMGTPRQNNRTKPIYVSVKGLIIHHCVGLPITVLHN